MEKIAIIGVGVEGFRSQIRELSYKEMTYQAATKAYKDADDLNPREDVDTFIACEEDLNMGVSITDEYAPDQLGAAQRTVQTITGDGIQGMAAAYMQLATGLFDVAVVESQSRTSDMLTHNQIQHFALDPLGPRRFDATHHAAAGLEKRAYMKGSGTSEDAFAEVVARSHDNALNNPHAAYGAKGTAADVMQSPMVSSPLRDGEIAKPVDGSVVVVMATEKAIANMDVDPVWIKGISYATNSPNYDTREWTTAKYAELCANKAYKMAGIENPTNEIDVFEVDNTYSYKELQHLESLGVYKPGEAGKALLNDDYGYINPSGGVLGMGDAHDTNGLQRIAELVDQLRGHAGRRQVSGAETGLAFSWRGVPTTAGALAILAKEMN